MIVNEVALLYSGGTDSTYTATLMTKIYDRIHLLSYDRFGFSNAEYSRVNIHKLKEKFGEERFVHNIINIDKEFTILELANIKSPPKSNSCADRTTN